MQRQRPGASTVSTPFNCSSLEAFLVLLLLVSLLLTLLGAILSAVLPLRISLDRRHVLLTTGLALSCRGFLPLMARRWLVGHLLKRRRFARQSGSFERLGRLHKFWRWHAILMEGIRWCRQRRSISNRLWLNLLLLRRQLLQLLWYLLRLLWMLWQLLMLIVHWWRLHGMVSTPVRPHLRSRTNRTPHSTNGTGTHRVVVRLPGGDQAGSQCRAWPHRAAQQPKTKAHSRERRPQTSTAQLQNKLCWCFFWYEMSKS